MTVARRRAAEQGGRIAETLAGWRLQLAGYRILARRFRCGAGEIDLIARRGQVLAFVEVKARGSRDAARTALAPAAMRRISAAAIVYAGRHGLGELNWRYDLVTVVGLWPRHERDIFRPETDARRGDHLF